MKTPIRIGFVTVSDRASRGEYQDLGGPAMRDCLTEILSCPWEAVSRIIPDERLLIEAALKELCGPESCCLVVTTGGTGPAPRDVDVLLIGEPDRDAAFEAARRAEQRLAREVNVTIRTAERWKTANDGFTTQLRSSPLLEIPLNVAGKRRGPDGGQGG